MLFSKKQKALKTLLFRKLHILRICGKSAPYVVLRDDAAAKMGKMHEFSDASAIRIHHRDRFPQMHQVSGSKKHGIDIMICRFVQSILNNL